MSSSETPFLNATLMNRYKDKRLSKMANDVSSKKVTQEQLDSANEFYKNPPAWAKDGGLEGSWTEVSDWAKVCHTTEDDDEEQSEE